MLKKSPLIIVILIYIGALGFYYWNFNNDGSFFSFSMDQNHWGVFGDYIGGITNPIIALALLSFVSKTYSMQKKEMENLKENLKIQIMISATSELMANTRREVDFLEKLCKQKEERLSEAKHFKNLQILGEKYEGILTSYNASCEAREIARMNLSNYAEKLKNLIE